MTDPGKESAAPAGPAETVFQGVGVSPGVAIGPARLIEFGALAAPQYLLATEEERAGDLERLTRALQKARRQLAALKAKSKSLPPAAAEEMGLLLDAHAAMLDESRLVRGVRSRIGKGVNAESAVQSEVRRTVRDFERLEDPYIAARAADVREVGVRVLRNLMEGKADAAQIGFDAMPDGAILIAEEISPAETAQLDPEKVGGFAAVLGGAEGHAAIVARSLGLPAVLGAPGLLQAMRGGETVIVDGEAGLIIAHPTERTLGRYRDKQQQQDKARRQLAKLKTLPAVTLDGCEIALHVNLELPREIEKAADLGADGVGLLRTEFMFMNRPAPPSEEEQYDFLRTVVEGMKGRPVTIRTLDVGGEKLAFSLGDALTDSLAGAANPALGVRAIRLSLREPKLFEAQLCAILRAAAHGPVRVLLPMVTTPGEVRQVREIMARLWRRLKRRGAALPEAPPPLGVMIEIPGAALAADALAQSADFFAIGSNDLTMYTLAIDRADDQVAHLYNPLHPAVLRLIEFSVQAALRARLPVSVCGEIAGDPRFTALLLGMGVRELSMAAPSLLRIKQRIRKLDLTSAADRARMVMGVTDAGRIAALLDDMDGLS